MKDPKDQNYIKTLGRSEDLDDKTLTQKTVVLLRMATFSRSSDMEQIRFSAIKIFESHALLDFHTKKQQRSSSQSFAQLVKRFEDKELCPVNTLECYLERTKDWRNKDKDDKLFLSLDKHHRAVDSQTIAKWALFFMQKAGIDTTRFKAASIRGAAASKALDHGATVDEVMRMGQWSSFSVFERFYNRSNKLIDVMGKITV